MTSLHISSKDCLPLSNHVKAIGNEYLRHVSVELFFEVEDLWVDDIVLEEDSPSNTILKAISLSGPRLHTLQLYSSKATSAQVLPLLAATIRASPWLTDISTTRVIRLSDAADVQCLADAVRGHPQLRDFKLIHPHVGRSRNNKEESNNTNTSKRIKTATATGGETSFLLDTLMVALSTIRQLSSVDITLYCGCDEGKLSFISTTSLRTLLQSAPDLSTLSLWGCGLRNEHLQVLMRKDGSSSTTTMDSHQHHHLQFLSLRRNPLITNWEPFYRSLVHNYDLKALYNDHADIMSADHPALTSHAATTPETSSILEAEICLSLNRWDRKYVLQEEGATTRQDFVDLLSDMTDSLDALYYLLSAKPSLVVESSSSSSSSACRHRRRHNRACASISKSG